MEGPPAPLRINPHAATLPFGGGHLEIVDRARLISMVAHIIVGQHLHVEMVLGGSSSTASTPSESVIKAALARIAPPQTDAARWHRDGWVFQMISWIAARGERTRRVISAPHMQPTKQGFDCLYLSLEPQDKSLTVCEDKATEWPRDVIRDEVFPEFTLLETGARDAELQSELTTLLRQGRKDEETAAMIEAIQWLDEKRYCATVTAPSEAARTPETLYKGFDKHVSGDRSRRSGNIFVTDALRAWLDAFCGEIAAAIAAMRPAPSASLT